VRHTTHVYVTSNYKEFNVLEQKYSYIKHDD